MTTCPSRLSVTVYQTVRPSVDEGKLLPGSAGDLKVLSGGIDDPDVRQAPRTILEILFKRSPSRRDQIAFTGGIVNLKHELCPGRQPRRKDVRNGPSRCPQPHGATLGIDTYALGWCR